MLNRYMTELQSSIQWAQLEDSIEVLNQAKSSMNRLLEFVDTLPATEQQMAQQKIDDVLPMEWPLWMEACRYGDELQPIGFDDMPEWVTQASATLH